MITALVLGALALTLAFTLAGMSFSHLTVSTKVSNVQQARSLAEAVIAQGIERIVTNEGDYFKTAPLDLSITMAGLPGGTGRLTFDPAKATTWKIPVSTNNLENDTSVNGAGGRVVPRKSIHFVGVGEYAGTTQRIEAILHIPTFKYALSSQGKIETEGAMIVASVDDPADVIPDVQTNLDADKLLPGHVVSNLNVSGGVGLEFGNSVGEVVVTGDARSACGIEALDGMIKGAKRENSDLLDFPTIEVQDFDPAHLGYSQDFTDPPAAVEVADGLFRHNGDLVLQKLRLPNDNTGALVYVNGNLEINDGVDGVGAIFATGDITIRGAGHSAVTSDNVVAVIAGKKLTVKGGGMNSAFFQGVVGSGGTTDFEDVTVLGAVLVGATRVGGAAVGGADQTLSLKNVNVVSDPNVLEFSFKYPFDSRPGGPSAPGYGFSAPNVVAADHTLTFDVRLKDGKPFGGEKAELAHFYDETTDSFRTDWTKWDGFTPYAYDESTHTSTGSPFGFYFKDVDFTTPGDQEGFITTRAQMKGVLNSIMANRSPVYGANGTPYTTWDAFFVGEPANSLDDVIDDMVEYAVHGNTNFEDTMELANEAYDDYIDNQPKPNGTFSLDPNRYLNWDSRTSIILWRDF